MNEQKALNGQSDLNQVGAIVLKFLPYWPLFVISISLSLVIAYVQIRAELPIYVAYAKILLKDPKSSDSKVLDQFNIMGEKKPVENEILVLRSAGLMQEVVRRLNLSVEIYNEGRVRIEELYKDNSPVYFIPLKKDSIYSGGKLYFDVDWSNGEVEIDGKKVAFNQTVTIGNTLYKIVPNSNYNKSVSGKNYYAVFYSVEEAAGNFIGSLSANAISFSSSVIDVNIRTPVPAKGIDILNTLFQVYNEYSIMDKNQTMLKTLAFIDDRLALVALQLDSVEQGVVDYKSQNTIFDLQAQAQNYFQQLNEMDQQKNGIQLQLTLLNNIRNYVLHGGTVPSMGSISDPGLTNLLSKLLEAETTLQTVSAVNGEKSNIVIQTKSQIANLRNSILENISNLEKTLNATKGNYSQLLGKNTSLLKGNPQKEKAFAAINRQQAVKNSIYNYLLEKREETALNSASQTSDLRILESSNAYGPVSPVPKSFYIKWLIIGLLVPASFVYLKDMLNRKVQSVKEIEQKTNIPIVAKISHVKTADSSIVIREGKRTAVAEQFRTLRTNLTFMGVSEKANTILVTSSISGEGKSFTALNLAISFALLGKKVALMEMDLRKPNISKVLNLSRDHGISNYLVGQSSFEDIIKPTEINHLFFISTGPLPPNPAELIQKDRFRQLMKEVKERFDYVIVDSAPVGPVSDSFLLKDHVDATVLLVRQNYSQRASLGMLEEMKRKKRFNNMCIVFNGIKKKGFVYDSYGNTYYGNEYGNGYYVQEETNGKVNNFTRRFKKTFRINS